MKSIKSFLFGFIALMICAVSTPTTMAYSTDADLYDRIDQEMVIQLTDDDNSGSVDQTVLDNKRADASEVINTYLRGKYEVPLDPAPKILTNIEADLLVHSLYARRANYEIPDSVKESKKDALDLLMKINQGKILLEDQPDVASGSLVTNKSSTDRLFPDDTLKQF
ncbi:gp436 family protein [Gracilimonas tropica]|uniref:gp436 family protein n=1 Tax=Gracilimonas tropica TaxID=454600 RepID=UPI00038271CF|nr:DUF1320 domain-containing protein [Gracilimonas tropica]